MKKYSTSLTIKEMQIKPHHGCHQEHKQQQMLVKMWGKEEPSYTVDGNVN
jgi:hypothetical protein